MEGLVPLAALAAAFCWEVPTPIAALCWHLDNRPDSWAVQRLPKGYWADHTTGWALSVYETGLEPVWMFLSRPTYRVILWRGQCTSEFTGKQARMLAKRVARLCRG